MTQKDIDEAMAFLAPGTVHFCPDADGEFSQEIRTLLNHGLTLLTAYRAEKERADRLEAINADYFRRQELMVEDNDKANARAKLLERQYAELAALDRVWPDNIEPTGHMLARHDAERKEGKA
jgi:hypothetical protein